MNDETMRNHELKEGLVYSYKPHYVDDGEEWRDFLPGDQPSCHAFLLRKGPDDWPLHQMKDVQSGQEFLAASAELVRTTRAAKEAA